MVLFLIHDQSLGQASLRLVFFVNLSPDSCLNAVVLVVAYAETIAKYKYNVLVNLQNKEKIVGPTSIAVVYLLTPLVSALSLGSEDEARLAVIIRPPLEIGLLAADLLASLKELILLHYPPLDVAHLQQVLALLGLQRPLIPLLLYHLSRIHPRLILILILLIILIVVLFLLIVLVIVVTVVIVVGVVVGVVVFFVVGGPVADLPHVVVWALRKFKLGLLEKLGSRDVNQVLVLHFAPDTLDRFRVQLCKVAFGVQVSIINGKALLSPVALTVNRGFYHMQLLLIDFVLSVTRLVIQEICKRDHHCRG